MFVRSANWFRHLMPAEAKARVILRSDLIIPFNSNKASSYGEMMQKIFAEGARTESAKSGPSSHASLAGAALASAGSADEGTDNGSGGDGGGAGVGGGDDDGDGDGDGDGPRRQVTSRRRILSHKPRSTSAARRRPSPLRSNPPPDPDRNHAYALLAFVVVIALVMGTVLACALNGQPGIAEKILDTIGSIASLASALLRR